MGPNAVNFWDYVLNPIFLITVGLVLAFFLPMLLSIWLTWEASDDKAPEIEPDLEPDAA